MAVTGPAPPVDEVVAVQRSRRTGALLIVAVSALIADQLTKWWAVNRLSRGTIDVVGSLRLNLVSNTGTAFSLGSGRGLGPVIALMGVVVVVVLVVMGGAARRTVGAVAAGLVIGGALGNLADRAFRGDHGFLHGAVIDFIDLQWWPIFNVADASIVVGAGLLALSSVLADRQR